MTEYRFRIEIIDTTADTVVESDYCTLPDVEFIDGFGGCEAIDRAVAKMLRNWRGFAKHEYEAEMYGAPEESDEAVMVRG